MKAPDVEACGGALRCLLLSDARNHLLLLVHCRAGYMLNPQASLRAVKVVHTIAWAFFASCIVAAPICTWLGELRIAAFLIAIVFVEVIIILVNHWRCPLTDVAARYTDDRRDNFDIYLPLWLARYNKHIFGSMYFAAVFYALASWLSSMR